MRVCFVCSGNICRSPSAEVVTRAYLAAAGLNDVEVSSAGIGDWHVGERADSRSLAELTRRGYDGSRHRARQFDRSWFADHDLVIAMDSTHERALLRMAPPSERHKVRLLMSFDPTATDHDVPDPYYGGPRGFVRVLDLVERGCRGLVHELASRR